MIWGNNNMYTRSHADGINTPPAKMAYFCSIFSGASINAICWCAASFKNWIRKPTSIKMGCQLSVCARFFSQKDRNAVRPETSVYIYMHTILAEYLEYREFQPYGCEQKTLRISEVEIYIYICTYIYIYWKINGTTHTYRWHIARIYKASSTRIHRAGHLLQHAS